MKQRFERSLVRAKSAVEEVFADDKDTGAVFDKRELWRKMWHGKSKYERIISMLRFIREVAPEGILDFEPENVRRALRDFSHAPFNSKTYDFGKKVGSGGVSQVHLLESKLPENKSWVVKIVGPDRAGKKPEEQIAQLRKEFEYIKSIYKEMPDLVPPEYYMLMEDPMRTGSSAAAIIQPFKAGKIHDVFTVSDAERTRLIEKSPGLESSLENFSRITARHKEDTGEIIDVLGDNNVAIVEGEKSAELVLLDPHVIYSFSDPRKGVQTGLREKFTVLERLSIRK